MSFEPIFECKHCNVSGTWDEWESCAEPGKHCCDMCVEMGRPGTLTPVEAPAPTAAKPITFDGIKPK